MRGLSLWGTTVLRVVVGIVFVVRAGHRLFFAGPATFAAALASYGVPYPTSMALVESMAELVAGAALLFGVHIRIGGGALAVGMMLVTLASIPAGFFAASGGFEYPLVLAAASAALALSAPARGTRS